MPAVTGPPQQDDGPGASGNASGVDPTRATVGIIFGLATGVAILGVLIFVFIRPRLRRHRTAQVTPDRLPTFHIGNRNSYHFPTHPALLRGFDGNTSAAIRQAVRLYDPRTATAFPSHPVELTAISGHSHPQSEHHAGPMLGITKTRNSNGLFTPARDRQGDRHKEYTRWPPLLSTKNVENERNTISASNGTHEYILPVPEPLALKPRPAGRPPPLTRQLERFPMPTTGLSRPGGFARPAKLFDELQQANTKKKLDVLNTPCPKPGMSNRPDEKVRSFLEITPQPSGNQGDIGSPAQSHELLNTPASKGSRETEEEEAVTDDKPETTTNKPSPKWHSLNRAGTLTRPKTPVSELRQWFDRTASGSKIDNSPYKRAATASSNPSTTPGLSTTPRTSPEHTTRTITAPSTPFHGPAKDISTIVSGAESLDPCALRRTPSSVALPPAQRLATVGHAVPARSTVDRLSKTLLPPSLFARRRGEIARNLAPISGPNLTRRHSHSSLSTIMKPMISTAKSKPSNCASSVYSDHNKGSRLSFISTGSPGGTEFADEHAEATSHKEFVPVSGQQKQQIPRRKTGSVDVLKSKIDEWDLHTADLDASAFTPVAIKRTFSDSGLLNVSRRHMAEDEGVPRLPEIRIGRMSMLSDESWVTINEPAPGSAPGGAKWL
ncbi:hypothetical protein LTR10_019546 [Elasticomyces elasticus]|uniref:Uncharacterized protein n=1 Tax=Exophiala sideris TaxID=1016849 RepID=A0ABR0J5E4_9EURO|nr:hypothetical protein LTR10_019546 [Elasticomyces elasticus]KAK5028511.1 hypothetical protein LTS07_006602 [Exophiala sideris]KAK5035847.1 hypothetical protein LTR13_005417 [Exophiala sideris]KAK5056883.1 hypothetical protein LTR69_007521 [Exophiala sideris]KAK5181290.1 hypothetical protein LTR44_006085 [Eurotiomycetes sp. CCFEE 6388]